MCLLTLGSAKKIMPLKNKRSIKDFMSILYLKHIFLLFAYLSLACHQNNKIHMFYL